jgi:hypothetical protein
LEKNLFSLLKNSEFVEQQIADKFKEEGQKTEVEIDIF